MIEGEFCYKIFVGGMLVLMFEKKSVWFYWIIGDISGFFFLDSGRERERMNCAFLY
ncbi:hypothetical protein Hanom_Chr12g01086241 [Helianthus anomalus]